MLENGKITPYRLALGLLIGSVMMLIWLGLGVGIIGKDDDPANMLFAFVFNIGIIGAILSRLKPKGMAVTSITMAVTQALIAIIAIVKGLGLPYSGPMEILLLNAFFIAMYLVSAWLLIKAKASQSPIQS